MHTLAPTAALAAADAVLCQHHRVGLVTLLDPTRPIPFCVDCQSLGPFVEPCCPTHAALAVDHALGLHDGALALFGITCPVCFELTHLGGTP